MRRFVVAALLLASCADDDGRATDDGVVARGACEDLERQAHSLRAGSCVLPSTPLRPGSIDTCPAIWGVQCGNDGSIDSCPDGYGISCDEPNPGMYVGCASYLNNDGTDQCEPAGADRVSYPAVATLAGRDGLIVVVGDLECEFRACE